MRVIAIISQKGGAGKSTLARQLAVVAGETGPSWIIDRDPQATSSRWFQRRWKHEPISDQPQLLELQEKSLTSAVSALKAQSGTLFLDTRPAVAEPEAEAARVADLVLVPVRPSLDDLEAVGQTLAMLRRLGRPTFLIVNAAKNERRAIEARAALACHPIPVCPHHITDRAIYLDAALAGLGVGEMKGTPAREAEAELRRVWSWIEEAAQ